MNNQRARAAAQLSILGAVLLLSSCSAADEPPASAYPTYDPFLREGAFTEAPFGAGR